MPLALGEYNFNVMTSTEQSTDGETRIRPTTPHLKSVLKRSTSFGPNSPHDSGLMRENYKRMRRASFSDDHGADLCSVSSIGGLPCSLFGNML